MAMVLASLDALKLQAKKNQFQYFFWNDEDILDPSTIDDVEDLEDIQLNGSGKVQPLLVDSSTASIVCNLHQIVNDTNKAKIERMIQGSRSQFIRLVEFAWKRAHF